MKTTTELANDLYEAAYNGIISTKVAKGAMLLMIEDKKATIHTVLEDLGCYDGFGSEIVHTELSCITLINRLITMLEVRDITNRKGSVENV